MSRKKLVIIVASIISLLLIAILANTIHQNNLAEKRAEARAERALADYKAQLEAERIRNDVSWVPDGYYADAKDKSIAYKWKSGAGNDCYSCRYWTLDVISRDGCPNGVSGEMNVEKNGVVISNTYDSISYLAPGQVARLSFETYEKGNVQGGNLELNCR